jgi:hypothetical protein
MPRLRPLTTDEAPPEVRSILERSAQTFGRVLDSVGIRAYCPPILEASQALAAAPAKSGLLSAELRGLVQLRAAQMVRCPF